MSAAIFRVNARYSNYRLNFARIADPVTRRLAKEYVIARLRIHVPGYRAPCGATSAIRLLRYIQHFAALLRTRLGAVDLGRVDQALLDAYLVHARDGGRRTPHETVKYVEVPIDLYHLSPWLSGGGLPFCRGVGAPRTESPAGRRRLPRTPHRAFPSRSSAPCSAGRSNMSRFTPLTFSRRGRNWTLSKLAAPG